MSIECSTNLHDDNSKHQSSSYRTHQEIGSTLDIVDQIKRLTTEKEKCLLKNSITPFSLSGSFCNRTWDNILCWPDTAAGHLVAQPCPHYIDKFDQRELVTRRCTENGTWWVNPVTGQTWSNYSACIRSTKEKIVPQLIEDHMPGIKLMQTIGYSLSLTTLILALSIMVYFRRLHCSRNIIHMNMFLAFGLRAVLSLLKNVLLVNDLGFINDVKQNGSDIKFVESGTHWECKLFFTLFYYIILSSVLWLFNEGLYLQLILSVAVFSDKTKIEWFLIIGWVMPVCFVLPWALCRIYLDDMLCWNVHVYKSLFWIIRGPMVASVAINFVIFINIIRMLFTKLRATNCSESKMYRYRKLAKSTLILIPLFAVYYMIFIWLPDDINPTAELFKMYVEMLFNSFQGFLVALLFCFLNHEVQYEIRKTWTRHFQQHTGGHRDTFSNHSLFFRSSDYQSRDQTRRKKKPFKVIRKRGQPLSDIAEETVLSMSTINHNNLDVSQREIYIDNGVIGAGLTDIDKSNNMEIDHQLLSSDCPVSPGRLSGLNDIHLINQSVVIKNKNADSLNEFWDITGHADPSISLNCDFLDGKDSTTGHNSCAILYVNNKTWSSGYESLVHHSTSTEVKNSLNTSNGLVQCTGQCVV